MILLTIKNQIILLSKIIRLKSVNLCILDAHLHKMKLLQLFID